jgi:hypothetical protein
MDYYVLTPGEATGLYLGLALQAWVRNSAFSWIPLLLMVIGVMRIIWQEVADGAQPVRLGMHLFGYVATSLLLLALFWPEMSPFGRLHPVDPGTIASYAASQDNQATIVTAADTREVSGNTFETPGFRLLLQTMTDTSLSLARLLNQQVHRAFSPTISMSWLLGIELTTDVTRALEDWVEACWKPSMLQDQEFQDAISARDLLPWGNSPVARALATREVVPGAMTGKGYFRSQSPLGLLFLSNPDSPQTVRCDVYLEAVQLDVERWLFTTTSPAGTPLSQVFQEDLGRDVAWQARFLIYREAMQALGRPSPAPSLGGAYAALSGARIATGAAGGAIRGAQQPRGGWLSGLFGAGQGALNQFDRVLDTLLWAVGMAMWLVYWSPYIFGQAFHVLVGLFPIPFAYAFVPHAQWRPLITYFLGLFYVCCSPLWFAIVDLYARNAAAQAPQADDAILSLFNWAPQQLYSVVVTVIGLALVQPLGAAVIFLTVRGLVGLFRR